MNSEIIIQVLAWLVSYCVIATLVLLLIGLVQSCRIGFHRPSASESSEALRKAVEVLKKDRDITSELKTGVPVSFGWELPGAFETVAQGLRNVGCEVELIKIADRDIENSAFSPEQFKNKIEYYTEKLTDKIRTEYK